MNQKGLLFIISAPSGAGKTSLCRKFVELVPSLCHSVSYTTRPPREGEKEGKDYWFISGDTFQDMIDNKSFAEWAEIHGNRYGTAASPLKERLIKGNDVILDIEGQGARQLKRKYPDGVYIFILPPSWKDLEERLRARKTESSEEIKKRLNNAQKELRYIVNYDYIVINDDFDTAISKLQSIMKAEKCRRDRIFPQVKARLNVQ